MVTFINRKLHGKEKSKRQFKQFVVSLASEWSKDESGREQQRQKLQNVMNSAEMYFMQNGFRAAGWIHCNTRHPHFHLLMDTCNAIDGKQFSQSKADLAEFKSFVSSQLMVYGLNEEILMNVKDITEEQLFEDEAIDCIPVCNADSIEDYDEENDGYAYDEYTLESQKLFFNKIYQWNSGTMEQSSVFSRTSCGAKREMCHTVDKTKREMVKLVDNSRPPKHEMLRLVEKTKLNNS